MQNFEFEKDFDGRWFIVLPGWPEEARDALEMVLGADTMCDIIAQGEDRINLTISEEPFDGFKLELTNNRPEGGGAWYDLKSDLHEFEIWLCEVTSYVFGSMPEKLYVNY